MKKVTKIVTLVAAGLMSVALIPAAAIGVDAVKAATVPSHNITAVTAYDDVDVVAPMKAREGERVDLDFDYDPEAYELGNVYIFDANDDELIYAETACWNYLADSWYFAMPEYDVLLYAYFIPLLEEETPTYPVTNVMAEEGVILNGIEGEYEEGDPVFFEVLMSPDSPFVWTGEMAIFSLDADGLPAGLIEPNMYSGYYYFFMPASPVFIMVSLETKGFLATFDSVDNVSKVEFSLDNGESYKAVSAVGTNYFIPGNADVKVTLKDSNRAIINGLNVDGNDLKCGEDKTVEFTMPIHGIDVVSLTDILWRNFSVNEAEKTQHYNWKIRVAEKSSGPFEAADELRCLYGQYVRLYPTLKDGVSGFKPKTIYIYYGDTGARVSTSLGNDEFGSYYSFYWGNLADGDIQVTDEYSAKKFKYTDSANIKVQLVTNVDGVWVPKESNDIFYGDMVYFQFVSNDPDIVADNIKVTYGSYNSTASWKSVDAANCVYQISSSVSDYDYTLTFSEVKAVYKDNAFLGDWFGANIYSPGQSYKTLTTTMSIAQTGWFAKGSAKFEISAEAGKELPKSGEGVMVINGVKCLFNDNWFVTDYYVDSSYRTPNDYNTVSDIYVYYHSQEDYMLYHYASDYSFMAIEIYNQTTNEIVDNAFFIMGEKYYIEDVLFIDASGRYLADVSYDTDYYVFVGEDLIGYVTDDTFVSLAA